MTATLELIAASVALVAAEATVSRFMGWARYELRDTLANIAMGLGALLAGIPGRAIAVALSWALYEYRLFEIPNAWWAWVLLLFAEDFCYYLFHRVSHTVPLFWAAHVPHHSSTKFNLSTALRAS